MSELVEDYVETPLTGVLDPAVSALHVEGVVGGKRVAVTLPASAAGDRAFCEEQLRRAARPVGPSA